MKARVQPEFGLQPHHLAVAQANDAKRCAAQRLCGFGQGRQHRLQVERRAADDLEHVGGRGLLIERFAQFGRPLLDLVLQVGIGFLKPCAHVVELVGETLEFIAGLDRDALGKIAAADAFGAGAQRLDRADHAPGQEYPREHREDRRRRQHDGKALQRGI